MEWNQSHTGMAMAMLCLPLTSSAQVDRFEFGLMGGVHIYQGDLTPSPIGSYRTPGWQGGILINYKWRPDISLRLNLSTGSLRGDDSKYASPAYRQQRNFAFDGQLTDISLVAQYRVPSSGKVSPYVFAGGGVARFSMARDYSAFNAEYFSTESSTLVGLAADTATSMARFAPFIPVGAGLRYPLSSRWSVFAETSYHLMSTDYLDGFSKAANPDRSDKYLRHSIGVIYSPSLLRGLNCPRIKY